MKLGLDVIVHHICTLIAYSPSLITNYGGHALVLGIFYAETSNFFYNLRFVLKYYDLRYSKAYELTECIFFLIFLIVRVFLSPSLIYYHYLKDESVPIIQTTCIIAIFLLSLYYSFGMVSLTKKKYAQLKERNQKRIYYSWFS